MRENLSALLFLGLALQGASAEAEAGALAAIHATGIVRFGLTGDYPPFALKSPDGPLAGADIMAAGRVAAALGAKPEFVTTTWQTLATDFTGGRFDIAIGGLTVTPERAAIGVFSVALLDDGKRPLARCADKGRFPTLESIDLPGIRVMINRGPAIGELARQWFTRAAVTVHVDDATLADQLLTGNTDVWVTDGVVVDLMARRYPGILCATTEIPFTHVTKAWLIRGDPALVDQVNEVLATMMASGEWHAAIEAVR